VTNVTVLWVFQILLLVVKLGALVDKPPKLFQILMHLVVELRRPEDKLGDRIADQRQAKAKLAHAATLAKCAYELNTVAEAPADAADECKVESALRKAASAVAGSEVMRLYSSTRSDITNVPFALALAPTGLVMTFRGTASVSDLCIDLCAHPKEQEVMVRVTTLRQ